MSKEFKAIMNTNRAFKTYEEQDNRRKQYREDNKDKV
jgi:hypothetical protein